MYALTFPSSWIACLAAVAGAQSSELPEIAQRIALLPEHPSVSAGGQAAEGSAWQASVSAEIQRQEYSFQPLTNERGTWSAPNRSQGFRSRISQHGLEVFPRETSAQESSSAPWRLSLRTSSVGRGEDLSELGRWPSISVQGERVEIEHGPLLEWFENRDEGLEQSWTIAAPPPGGDPLWIGLEFGGDLSFRIDEGARSGVLVDASGALQLRYRGLTAFDATGRELRARLASSPNGVGIEIDDGAAIYPLIVDPVLSGPAWTAESDQSGAHFGTSVASAGDVNGDGYSDVIVGAHLYDDGQTDAGRAFVYLGSAGGLAVSPAWTAGSNQGSAHFGWSVATAGDVNGDGYSDVIVGAPDYDNGQTNEGRAFLYLGSAAGLAASPASTAENDQDDAHFGYCVATAGDVSGDGYSDVIIGAPGFDNPQIDEGRAYLYLGSAGGLMTRPAWTAEGDQFSADFGWSVATAGDVNGDGYSDVIVGAPEYEIGPADEGRAFVYLGVPGGLPTGPAWSAVGDQFSAHFGWSVATAGDVDGDGYGDVIVGAPESGTGGRAILYRGVPGGLMASPAWTAESNQFSAYFGSSVATAGDVNGDGSSDVIVGAPFYDNGQVDEGRAFVYLGSAGGLATSAGWTAESDQPGAQFGFAVATAGDVNGDGYSDLIVGAPSYDDGQTDEGRAFAYMGSASGLATSSAWMAESDQADCYFSYTVATAGDVNGDGFSDVIVGAPTYDHGQTDEGRAFVYMGSASGLATSPAWTAESDQVSAYLGSYNSAATAGDVNGDGYSDVIVGAHGYDNGEQDEGVAFLYLGSAAGLATSPAWTAEGNQASAFFGASAAAAGDVNGDGYGDVIVGAVEYFVQTDGRAFVYLGSAAGLAASPAWTAASDQTTASFAFSVATAGDVNADGYSDVIVGAPLYDHSETDEGRAFVYLGSAAGLATIPAWTAESDQASAHFGTVATAGDVNGDGYSDVIVGAVGYDNGQTDEGRAFAYLGSATGLATSPAWTAESDQASATFGIGATAGDVNGDGYSDVIVGARGYDNGQEFEGRAFAYLGSVTGLASSPAWTAEGDQYHTYFGYSAATAGDVNGDGYSDVIVGALFYDNGQNDEGGAFVYLGNDGRGGWILAPQQRRTSGAAPIALLGVSNSLDGFALRVGFERALAGFTWSSGLVPTARLEWEVEELGVAFDSAGLGSGTPQLVHGSALTFDELALGLVANRPYHWRARLRTNNPLFPVTPWFTLQGNNRTETKLRTVARPMRPQ